MARQKCPEFSNLGSPNPRWIFRSVNRRFFSEIPNETDRIGVSIRNTCEAPRICEEVRVALAVRSIILSLLLVLSVVVPSHAAQGAAARARLMVTVTDSSGGVIPDATVTIVGLDDALKSATIPGV